MKGKFNSGKTTYHITFRNYPGDIDSQGKDEGNMVKLTEDAVDFRNDRNGSSVAGHIQLTQNFLPDHNRSLFSSPGDVQVGAMVEIDAASRRLDVANVDGTNNTIEATNANVRAFASEINTINMTGGTLELTEVNDRTLGIPTDTEVIADGNTKICDGRDNKLDIEIKD